MNEPRIEVGTNVEEQGKQRVGQKRTPGDIFLMALWVAGYSVVLWIFQVAQMLEGMRPAHRKGSLGTRPRQGS
jgi:hypothetical protein